MDIFDTRYFRVNKLFLSFVGLWPFQSGRNIFLCNTVLGGLIILLPQIAFLFKCAKSLNDIYDVLPVFIGGSLCLLKTLGLHWQIENFRMLIEHIRHDWYLLAKHRDIWILMEYAEKNRIFTLAYLTLAGTSTVIISTIPPLLDVILASNATRPKRMPHPTEFFLDIEKHYYTLMAITFVGYVLCAMTCIATDTTYFALLQHTCGILTILSYRLKEMTVHNKSKCIDHNPVFKGDRNIEYMVECVQLQNRIERLIHLIESTFALSLFVDVGFGIAIQCISCVMIATQTEIMKNIPLLIIQTVRFFFNSWLGQNIIDKSSHISVDAYNGLWYQMSLEAKRMLLFLIMRCQKPYCITIVKLYIICLESYSMLMKTSASYITLMLSLRSDDK